MPYRGSQETLKKISQIKQKVQKLEDKIAKEAMANTPPKKLKKEIKKLAKLKKKATMIHLKCIFKTRKILSKKQLQIISK